MRFKPERPKAGQPEEVPKPEEKSEKEKQGEEAGKETVEKKEATVEILESLKEKIAKLENKVFDLEQKLERYKKLSWKIVNFAEKVFTKAMNAVEAVVVELSGGAGMPMDGARRHI